MSKNSNPDNARISDLNPIAGADPGVRVELDRFGVAERIGADHVFERVKEAHAAFDTV
ncbi:MAG TPA: hypothetical protein VHI51_11200 [Ktedonobacterales bacterium]|jgi:hypothetical protein|nr:hypothetical protein [Ktedonobacterales bacterium]